MPGLFISYRRGDSAGHAGRLHDGLIAALPQTQVVIDVDSVRPGEDFAERLASAVTACESFLAVIGPGWLDARDLRGNRRLDDPGDLVRVEIETALRHEALVIPVLVGGARVPSAADLPPSLAGLARRHAVELSDARWHQDLRALVAALEAPPQPADPPMRVTQPHNLPAQAEPLVGREREVADVRALFERARVVTLTGAGGSGKTRLAVQTATDMLATAPDGVWFAELSSVDDAGGLASAVGDAMGLREDPERAMEDRLPEYVATRRLLLVLDTCEHVIDASAALVSRLITSAPGLRILATSREPLGVAGEQAFRVPSLALPAADADVEAVLASEAGRLFEDRARRRSPDFRIGPDNAAEVAGICRRLDGMPLSIELAAARIASMSPAEIHARLDQRFRLLTGGRRTAVARQQSLYATVEWSFRLLESVEQRVLRRLAVFAGSFDLAAAESVGADGAETWEVVDALSALVDKSLLQADIAAGETRYRLLETIRQFASEELHRAGEGEAALARRAHAAHYLQLAEEAAPLLRTGAQRAALDRLERERDELHGALAFLVDEPGAGAPATRMAAALNRFWHIRGYSAETRELVNAAVELPELADAPADAQVMALEAAATMCNDRGELTRGLAYAEQATARSRAGDEALQAFALQAEAFNRTELGEDDRAARLLDEARERSGRSGDRWVRAIVDHHIAAVISGRAANEDDLAHLLAATAMLEELGDEAQLAVGLINVANLELELERLDAAREHLEAATVAAERAQAEITMSFALVTLGSVLACRGDWAEAEAVIGRLAALMERIGVESHRPYMLLVLAQVALGQGDGEHAAELHGAIDATLHAFGTERLQGVEQRLREQDVARLKEILGTDAFAAALERGRHIDVPHLLAQLARSLTPVPVPA